MRRQTITLQFIQNGIILLKNSDILEYQFKSVDNYKIINKDDFINEISPILNNQNINKQILTDNINLIIDNTYTSIEKDIIINIFKELSFNNISFQNITDILNIKEQELIIDISTNNIKIYYINGVIEQKIYFNQYHQLLSILLKNIKESHNIKIIKLFGNKCNNPKIISKIEKHSNAKVYIYSHPNQVPINLLTQ